MESFTIRGNIILDGNPKKGTFRVDSNGVWQIDQSQADFEGTMMLSPMNFHIHSGDSFIEEEPLGTLSEIVGPTGFKMKHLNEEPDSNISLGILRTVNFMKKIGTYGFIDFREQGLRGIKLIPKFKGINGIFLSRPSTLDEAEKLIDISGGFGMSSISDNEFDYLMKLRELAKEKNKLFSIHFSENIREDIGKLLQLHPDFIVHGIESTDEDLIKISKSGIYCVVTPRSNLFYGKKPDYSRFIKNEVPLMLGTDNVFSTEPDIFTEMDFLYRYQRHINRISPIDILKFAIWNPRKFLNAKGINFPYERYLIFLDDVTAYQIVTRGHMYDSIIVDIPNNV